MEELNKILSIICKDNYNKLTMLSYGRFQLRLIIITISMHAYAQEFMDSLFSYMFIPLINRPTRLTSHSATLIDNINYSQITFKKHSEWDYF